MAIKTTCERCGRKGIRTTDPAEQIVSGLKLVEAIANDGTETLCMPCLDGKEVRECENCGHTWPYGGDSDRPTCPNCKGKNNEPINSDQ